MTTRDMIVALNKIDSIPGGTPEARTKQVLFTNSQAYLLLLLLLLKQALRRC